MAVTTFHLYSYICFYFVGDFSSLFNPDLAKIYRKRLMIEKCFAGGKMQKEEDEEAK